MTLGRAERYIRGSDWAVSSAGEHILDMDGVTGSIPVPPTRKSLNYSMLYRHHSNPTSPLFFGEARGKHPAGITARSWFSKRPPVKSSDAALTTLRNGAAPSVARSQPRGCRHRRQGSGYPPIQREIPIRGIAGSKWANRRALWQTSGLASPPEPPGVSRAEGRGKRPVSVENFDTGASLWVNVVQRFAGCASFWVGNHCPCHRCLLRR